MSMRRLTSVLVLVGILVASWVVLSSHGASAKDTVWPGAGQRQSSLQDTIVVTSTADSGAGSLRAAIGAAGPGDTITFDTVVFPPGSPVTIALATELPALPGNVTLDGSDAGVVLDGSGCPADADGISMTTDGNVIKGLQILFFGGDGVEISGGAKENTVGGDRTVGSGPSGEGNVISGNGDGIRITGNGTMSNSILGNHIGVDVSGTVDLGNGKEIDVGGWGILIDGATNNVIGDGTDGGRNIVSGNGDLYCGPPQDARHNGGGIMIQNGADDNVVAGNYVGLDVSGAAAIPNAWVGIAVENATGNLIGGPSEGDRNVVSGNSCNGPPPPRAGVRLDADYNTVQGNYIGTDVGGTLAFPAQGNGYAGVWCRGTGNGILDNLISGNSLTGIDIWGSGTLVTGNLIGTDATGTAAVGNQEVGVQIANGASGNLLGGINLPPGGTIAAQDGGCAGDCNVISGHSAVGVLLDGSSTVSNTILGNLIGTDVTGAAGLPNVAGGIVVRGGANRNAIGGADPGWGNVVALNGAAGLMITGTATLTNTITRNSIHSNVGLGIDNVNGGNLELAPPTITAIDWSGTVTGTACSACTVEVFSDDDDEGQYYEGTTVADAGGAFGFAGAFTGRCVTATATDGAGNTSEFSAPWCRRAYLPLVQRGS